LHPFLLPLTGWRRSSSASPTRVSYPAGRQSRRRGKSAREGRPRLRLPVCRSFGTA